MQSERPPNSLYSVWMAAEPQDSAQQHTKTGSAHPGDCQTPVPGTHAFVLAMCVRGHLQKLAFSVFLGVCPPGSQVSVLVPAVHQI